MKQKLAWCFFAVVAFAIALVPQLPAQFLVHHLMQNLVAQKSPVALLDARGNVYAGSVKVATNNEGVGTLSWQWRPSALLTGSARFELAFAGNSSRDRARSTMDIGLKSLAISQLAADFDVTELARWSSAASFLAPRGRLTLQSDSFVLTRVGDSLGTSGAITGELADLSVAQSAVKPLGSYRIGVSSAEDHIALSIQPARGPLEVTAKGELKARERGRLDGTFKVAATADAATRAALAPVLQNFGTPAPGNNADGKNQFALTLPALLPAR
jgi:hypothetical protein